MNNWTISIIMIIHFNLMEFYYKLNCINQKKKKKLFLQNAKCSFYRIGNPQPISYRDIKSVGYCQNKAPPTRVSLHLFLNPHTFTHTCTYTLTNKPPLHLLLRASWWFRWCRKTLHSMIGEKGLVGGLDFCSWSVTLQWRAERQTKSWAA